MSVIWLLAERHKRRKAAHHRAQGEDTRAAIVEASHRSIADFLASAPRRLDLAREGDDAARIFCAEETHFGGNLSQISPCVPRDAAGDYGSLWLTGIGLCELVRYRSGKLLQHARSLCLPQNGATAWPLKTQSPGKNPAQGRGTI